MAYKCTHAQNDQSLIGLSNRFFFETNCSQIFIKIVSVMLRGGQTTVASTASEHWGYELFLPFPPPPFLPLPFPSPPPFPFILSLPLPSWGPQPPNTARGSGGALKLPQRKPGCQMLSGAF